MTRKLNQELPPRGMLGSCCPSGPSWSHGYCLAHVTHVACSLGSGECPAVATIAGEAVQRGTRPSSGRCLGDGGQGMPVWWTRGMALGCFVPEDAWPLAEGPSELARPSGSASGLSSLYHLTGVLRAGVPAPVPLGETEPPVRTTPCLHPFSS